jgi:hypothetical protein
MGALRRVVVVVTAFLTSAPAAAHGDDVWFNPIDGVRATISADDESARPYSTLAQPRQIAGALSLSCEHREGDPCGDGLNGFLDVDSRAGYGTILTGSIRLRGQLGDSTRDGFRANRAHLELAYWYAAAKVGRDAIVLGPSARTQLSWGDNSPPIDHVAVGTAKPIPFGSHVGATGFYAIGELRGPQTYRHSLATIGRGELHITKSVDLGIVHLLEVEGEGAPDLGIWDFIAEHFRRKDLTATETDTSNRRFGGDVSVRISSLSARAYYVIVFEDIRKARWMDALRYDADHLFGIEHARPGLTVVAEYQQTGFRSQTHTPRETGFTNGGYPVGSPLGPDASSEYVSARFTRKRWSLAPWFEHAQIRDDEYIQVTHGPISQYTRGHREFRDRIGVDSRIGLAKDVWAELELRYEHVTNFAFVPGDTRNNVGVTASIVWYPMSLVGTLRL